MDLTPNIQHMRGGLPLLSQVLPYAVIDDFKQVHRGTTAGVHLLRAWGTNAAPGISPLVSLHELQHDVRLRQSTFGFVQRIYKEYLQPGMSRRWHKRGDDWSAALARASRVAHEEAATYLSIKALRLSDEGDALATLNPEYQAYYHSVGDLLDNHLASSHMQFAVADTMMYIAFASPLLHRLADARDKDKVAVLDGEAPDFRLGCLKALLRETGPQTVVDAVREEMAAYALKHTGMRRFGVDKESDWLRLTVDQRVVLEHRLSICVMQWFGTRQFGGLDLARPTSCEADARQLVNVAVARGVVLGVFGKDFVDQFWPNEPIDLAVATGLSAAESVLFNERVIPESHIKTLDPGAWVEPTNPATAKVAVLCAEEMCIGSMPDSWYINVVRRDAVARERIVSSLAVKKKQLRSVLSDGLGRINDLYVIGLPSPNGEIVDSLLRETITEAINLFRCDSVEAKAEEGFNPYTHPGSERLVFYMHGNMLTWANWFAERPGTRYSSYVFHEGETPSRMEKALTLASIPRGCGACVFQCDLLPMRFIRFLNCLAFARVDVLIRSFAERDGRIELSRDLERRDADVAMLGVAMGAIEAVWQVF